jgi:1-deoxy-D-xylulose 5-phosphate reductoisomerase
MRRRELLPIQQENEAIDAVLALAKAAKLALATLNAKGGPTAAERKAATEAVRVALEPFGGVR